MIITVQFFSFLRQLTGQNELQLELAADETVAGALAELDQRFPRLREAEATTLLAIGVEFAKRTDKLRDGDVLSLMPPLQGGTADELELTDQPIAASEAAPGPSSRGVGGVVVFWGVVRERENAQPIRGLEYTAYRTMAEHQFRAIIAAAKAKWPISQLRIVHRLGAVPVGEASLLVRVEAAHRAEAFAAGQFLIDELKQKVPIWKKILPVV